MDVLLPDQRIFLAVAPPRRRRDRVDWDAERRPIDTIVVHHAASVGDLSPAELSQIGLERIYAPLFEKGNDDPFVPPGSAPYSGHFIQLAGEVVETFASYHSTIRLEGVRVNLLLTSAVGWHAGDWDINCSSLGLCLLGNYEETEPSSAVLSGAAWQITRWCVEFPSIRYLVGHREVRKIGPTVCPGDWYYRDGRERLIRLASEAAGRPLNFLPHPAAVRPGLSE